jgi:hypothetical protein
VHTKVASKLQKNLLPYTNTTTESTRRATCFLQLWKHVCESSPLYYLQSMQLTICKYDNKSELGSIDQKICISYMLMFLYISHQNSVALLDKQLDDA